MSYTHFATIKLEIKTKGCLWRKLRQPFELNLSTTDHKRTTKGPQAATSMHALFPASSVLNSGTEQVRHPITQTKQVFCT
ncbi:hypothetical protein HDF11_004970 [Tunturiibacter psychrotolerans]